MKVDEIKELIKRIDENLQSLDLGTMSLKDKIMLRDELKKMLSAKNPLAFTLTQGDDD